MAETLSPHYSWVKPDIGGDASTWGNVLNTTIDAVDSVVYANQQAGLPIGSVSMFAGATVPSNWLICDGRSLPTTGGTYDALFGIIGHAYGGSGANFNLPNLVQNFPLGAGPNPVGAAGGAFAVTLATANLPAHAHSIIDVTHSHSAYQGAHSHGISTGSHSHGITDNGHTHAGVVNVVGTPGWNSQGPASPLIAQTSTSNAMTGITIQAVGNLGGSTDSQTPGVGVNASGTGLSTTQNAGSGAAFNVVPPFVAINFIVRYK